MVIDMMVVPFLRIRNYNMGVGGGSSRVHFYAYSGMRTSCISVCNGYYKAYHSDKI